MVKRGLVTIAVLALGFIAVFDPHVTGMSGPLYIAVGPFLTKEECLHFVRGNTPQNWDFLGCKETKTTTGEGNKI